MATPSFTLASGSKIPAIGFGSGTKWQWAKKGRDEAVRGDLHEDLIVAVKQALDKGFRHLDTAETYTTEPEISEAVARSGLLRDEVFITSKYNTGHPLIGKAVGDPYEALSASLKKLNMDHVDLYLIHSPIFYPDFALVNLEQAWKSMERIQKEGLAKSVGVSNFDVSLLKQIFEFCEIKPAVNQIEFHPYLANQTPGIVEFCQQNGILIEAYAPLAPLFRGHPGPLDKTLSELAAKYGKSQTQILLRWVYQQGILPITTTSNADRCTDALETFTFVLSDEDSELISKIGKTKFFRAFFIDEYGKFDEELKKDYILL